MAQKKQYQQIINDKHDSCSPEGSINGGKKAVEYVKDNISKFFDHTLEIDAKQLQKIKAEFQSETSKTSEKSDPGKALTAYFQKIFEESEEEALQTMK